MATTKPAVAAGKTPKFDFVLPVPMQIKSQLDQFVIGQDVAKATLSSAIHKHYLALTSDHETPDGVVVDEFTKFNGLLIGPTGSGKTYLLDTLARIAKVPFASVDMTKITESGYIGDKVENILRTLYIEANFDLERAQAGIIYLDEFDKIARHGDPGQLDVSGEGVQKGLLSLLGGSSIAFSTKDIGAPKDTPEIVIFDTRRTHFWCGGAFVGLENIIGDRVNGKTSIGYGARVVSRDDDPKRAYELLLKVSDRDLERFGIIPELIGRLPVRTAVMPLDVAQLRAILTEPRNNIIDQYRALYKGKVRLEFSEEALMAIAREAYEGTTGARAIARIVTETMQPTDYLLPKEKRIEKEDVESREALYGQAISTKPAAGGEKPSEQMQEETRMFIGGAIAEPAKPVVARQLELPTAAWEVWRRGGEGYFIRLLCTADSKRFYHICTTVVGTCGACKTKTEVSCEWFVPYKKGANPFAMIGIERLGWTCKGCSRQAPGDLDMSDSNYGWSPED